MTKNRWIQVVTILFVIGIIAVLIINLQDQGNIVGVGDEAYDFKLEDQDGKLYQLSDYKGKPVVLNFFSTWCKSCHAQAPSMIEFEKEIADAVQVFTVVRSESTRTLEQYMERTGFTERLYIFDFDTEVSDRYGVVGQPETIIIDEKGIIVDHIIGPISGGEVADIVNSL